MDWLTLVSNAIASVMWPAVVLTALLLFKRPLTRVMLSLKWLRYKDLEIELVAPDEAGDQEIRGIVSYLQRSPHSFQWFRDNTEFTYSDQEFATLIAKHAAILERVNIISRDEETRKGSPGLPGMRLTRQYRESIAAAAKTV